MLSPKPKPKPKPRPALTPKGPAAINSLCGDAECDQLLKKKKVLPLTILYVGMLSGTNYCLRHVDISFYQVHI
jgi:hypothetical protein